MNSEEAQASVDALIEDLRYLMGTRPHTEWPGMADAALDYHDPLIPEHLLSWQYRRLQRAAHLALKGLSVGNVEQIRAGVTDIRTIENLEDSPTTVMPTPPNRGEKSEVDLDLTVSSDPPITERR